MAIFPMIMIAILACLVGGYAVRSATIPSPMPLIAFIGTLGSIIIVGALVVSAESSKPVAHYLGLAAIMLAAIPIFGGLTLVERMRTADEEKDRA